MLQLKAMSMQTTYHTSRAEAVSMFTDSDMHTDWLVMHIVFLITYLRDSNVA